MIVIVGHGPSVYRKELGAVIDSMTVVRLKRGLHEKSDPKFWGTRTDFLCARSLVFRRNDVPFWHFNDPKAWISFYKDYSHKKPSTGLCAVLCAIDRGHKDIALIGFDSILNQAQTAAHDHAAELKALKALDINITDLVTDGQVCGQKSGVWSGDVGGLDVRGPPPTVPLPAGRGTRTRTRQGRADKRSD